MAEDPLQETSFAQRREQVRRRRILFHRLRVMRTGVHLLFGGPGLAPIVAVVLLGAGMAMWHRHWQGSKGPLREPSQADREYMRQAITQQDPSLCNKISDSVSVGTSQGLSSSPGETLRSECHRRVALARRNTSYGTHLSPIGTGRLPGQSINPEMSRQGIKRPAPWSAFELSPPRDQVAPSLPTTAPPSSQLPPPSHDMEELSRQQQWERERQRLEQAQRKNTGHF